MSVHDMQNGNVELVDDASAYRVFGFDSPCEEAAGMKEHIERFLEGCGLVPPVHSSWYRGFVARGYPDVTGYYCGAEFWEVLS